MRLEEENASHSALSSGGTGKRNPVGFGRRKKKVWPGSSNQNCCSSCLMSECGRRIPNQLIPFEDLRSNHSLVRHPDADVPRLTFWGTEREGHRGGGLRCVVTQAPKAAISTRAAPPDQDTYLPTTSHPTSHTRIPPSRGRKRVHMYVCMYVGGRLLLISGTPTPAPTPTARRKVVWCACVHTWTASGLLRCLPCLALPCLPACR